MRRRSSARRSAIRIIVTVALVVCLVAAVFLGWALTPLGPSQSALATLADEDGVSVSAGEDLLLFTPADDQAHVGVILYPGGRVDFRAYAPLAREIAARGYLVAVPRMPLNLAVLGRDRALGIVESHPEVVTWAIGGHSLGGAMACSLAAEHPGEFSALILLAAYPAAGDDLSNDGELSVLSMYGTRDGILSQDAFSDAADRLPPTTSYVPIVGGNHAGFGDYGDQPGDLTATLDPERQLSRTAESVALHLRPFRLRSLDR